MVDPRDKQIDQLRTQLRRAENRFTLERQFRVAWQEEAERIYKMPPWQVFKLSIKKVFIGYPKILFDNKALKNLMVDHLGVKRYDL